MTFAIIHLSTSKDHNWVLSSFTRCLYTCLKWTRAFDTVLKKGAYEVKWSAYITWVDRWHRDVYLRHLVPSLSSTPFPFFFSCYQLITLLSCCWDVYIFSCLLRLFYCLKSPRILSFGIFRWAWNFFTSRKQKLS